MCQNYNDLNIPLITKKDNYISIIFELKNNKDAVIIIDKIKGKVLLDSFKIEIKWNNI